MSLYACYAVVCVIEIALMGLSINSNADNVSAEVIISRDKVPVLVLIRHIAKIIV